MFAQRSWGWLQKSGSNNKITISRPGSIFLRLFHVRLLNPLSLEFDSIFTFSAVLLHVRGRQRTSATFLVSQTNQLSNRCKKFQLLFLVSAFMLDGNLAVEAIEFLLQLLEYPLSQFHSAVQRFSNYVNSWKILH